MSYDIGGNSGRYFSFGDRGTQPGAWIAGHVVDMKEVQATNYQTKQPEFWDNGDPKMQYRVTLQTDLRDPADQSDTGLRDVYLDGRRRPNDDGGKSKLCAVLDAVKAATGGTALEQGDWLALKWISGLGNTGDPRCYDAQYQRGAMDIGQQQPTQPTPPPPPPAPPVQPVQQQQQPAPPPGWAQPAPPVQQQQPVQSQSQGWGQPAAAAAQAAPVATEQGPVNPVSGEIQQQPAPPGPSPEQVAAVKAAGLDPAVVFAGQPLPPTA